jgi:hypothetical protein
MSHAQFLVGRHRASARGRDTVLAKWGRELRAIATFPVQFRSGIDRAPFLVITFFVLYYALAPGYSDPDAPVGNFLNYLFAILLLPCVALIAVARQRINLPPLFPVAPLLLSVVGCISLAYSTVAAPGTTTYASALIPLIIAAIPLLIPTQAVRTDSTAATEYLFKIFGVFSLFHVLWQMPDYLFGFDEADPRHFARHASSGATMLVYFMILSGLFRRNLLLALSIALIGLSMVLRPTSTGGFAAIFAIALIVLYRLQYRRLFRLLCIVAAGVMFLGQLAVLESEEVAQAAFSIEPLLKENAMASHSNNEFRLGIISAVRDEMAEQSILVGKVFSGNVNIDARKYLGQWLI